MTPLVDLAERFWFGGLWHGLSGALVSGSAVAAHLTAAADVLAEDGWDPHRLGAGCRVEDALAAAALSAGDGDTLRVAERCLELVLCARTGASGAAYQSWERMAGRTDADVEDLLRAAAGFARGHGPSEVVS